MLKKKDRYRDIQLRASCTPTIVVEFKLDRHGIHRLRDSDLTAREHARQNMRRNACLFFRSPVLTFGQQRKPSCRCHGVAAPAPGAARIGTVEASEACGPAGVAGVASEGREARRREQHGPLEAHGTAGSDGPGRQRLEDVRQDLVGRRAMAPRGLTSPPQQVEGERRNRHE